MFIIKKKNFLFNWFIKKKKKSKEIKKKDKNINFKKKIIKNISSLWNNITKTVSLKFKKLFFKKKIDNFFFDQLEKQLILSDFGVNLTIKIIDKVRYKIKSKNIIDSNIAYLIFKNVLKNILFKITPYKNLTINKPYIILVVGVNGVGKTSSIGKLARRYLNFGKSVMLAAGDTFRPGAIEQLKKWGSYSSIPVIAQMLGSDSASVIYDTIQSAKSKNIDIVIADTAGRLHNNLNLMKELQKIINVIKKIDIHAPHEILLVLDATNGQNSIQQTKEFHKLLNINGIILTKLDGTAKGGIIFSIIEKFSIPISYISVGENINDLLPFNNQKYLDNFFFKK